MRLKYYIRGMGAGIVLTTIILAISGSLKNAGAADSTQDVTTATTGSVIAYTTVAATQKATDSTTVAQQDTTTAAQVQTTVAETTATTAETTTATTSVSQNQGVEKGQAVQVTIKNVYYSTQAADILYNAGVIDDRSAFNSYMQSSGYATKIQEGTYTVTKGADFEEIAKIITKSK